MSKPRILIVDDEVFFRHLFTDILSEGGLYEIEAVNSGKKALDYLTRKQVDVILADMIMPEICGLELIRRTRQFNPAPDIILATGNATVETAIEALKSGARDYLIKPCNPEQLRHTVKSCIEQRRLLAENSHLHSQIRLYQRGQQLSGQLNVESLFQSALSALLAEMGSDRGLAFLYDQNSISNVVGTGFDDEEAAKLAGLLTEHTSVMPQATILHADDCPGIKSECPDLKCMWVFPMNTELGEHGALILCNPSNAQGFAG